MDCAALISGRAQPGGEGFQLYRIEDAVEARNTHAAIDDALRLVRTV